MAASLCDPMRRVWTGSQGTGSARAALARFLADWPAAHPSEFQAPPTERPLPVLRWLPKIAADAGGYGAEFVAALCAQARTLDWQQTYRIEDVGERFLQNYGWVEILTPGPATGMQQISGGALVLGPDTFYPSHRHEAEEIYLPLAGTAEWLQGDSIWRERPPGTLIHHSSEEPHAMRTGEHPLLAIYLWRSSDLGQDARLDLRGSE